MRWSFEFNETSNGVYFCVGNRGGHISVERQCEESRVHLIYLDAFKMETSMETPSSEALYHIVAAAKSDWGSRFDRDHFGSWYVARELENESFIFDGHDNCLSVRRESRNERLVFRIEDSGEIEESVFKLLADGN